MNSLLFDFHSILTVRAAALTQEMAAPLTRRFGSFLKEHRSESSMREDIVAYPLDDPPAMNDTSRYTYALFGFSLFHHRGEPAIGFLHRGLPDILIKLSDPIQILYRPRKGNQRRFYGAFLFAIHLGLKRKQALLVHGAVAVCEGKSLLISSHRGGNKTQVLLNLLDRKCSYLSDDKFILYRQAAYLFESSIYLKEHHFSTLGRLNESAPRSSSARYSSRLRTIVRPLVHRWLPGQLSLRAERVLNPRIDFPVQSLFPSCSIIERTGLTHAFVLLHGEDFSIEKEPVDDGIGRMGNIHEMLFSGTSPMEKMLSTYSGRAFYPPHDLLKMNLPDIPFYVVTIPDAYDFRIVAAEILRCCEAP